MKKKLYITRAVKLISFALAVLLMCYLLQAFVLKHNDNNTLRMDGFFVEDKDTLDVAVIGASDVYAGFASPLAYDKYGITSYPFATQSAPPQAVIYQIQEVIKNQHPKLILVEVNSFTYRDNQLPKESSHRMFVDNVPRDEIWRDYIKNNISEDKRLEFYFPLIKYHGSWSDYPWKIKFLMSDLAIRQRGYSLFRGFKTVANEFHPTGKLYNDKTTNNDETMPISATSEKYLKELLDYLSENNIKNVVFTRFPHILDKNSFTRFKLTNAIGNLIESYGYDFINLERYSVQEGFDIKKDFYNWDHLNIYGSEKLTNFYCQKFINEYGITPAALTEEQKAEWQKSANYYYMIYDYSREMINTRNKQGLNDNGGDTITEDEECIKTIEDFARKNHPELLDN